MSEVAAEGLRETIESLLATLAQIIGPAATISYVERLAERMREEWPHG